MAVKTCQPRDKVQDTKAAQDIVKRGITGMDVVKALAKNGYPRSRRSDPERAETARFR